MNNKLLSILLQSIALVLIQVLVLNNVHYLRVATPFLYLYILLKLPIQTPISRSLLFSFCLGLAVDIFSNTIGMHAAVCTFIGFIRERLIQLFLDKKIPEGTKPSFSSLGYGMFIRYTLLIVLIHHSLLFLIESFSLFDSLFLLLRIVASSLFTCLLIFIVETFNLQNLKNDK